MTDFPAPDLEREAELRHERCVKLADKRGVRLHRLPALGLVGVVRDPDLAQEFASAGAGVQSWAEAGSKIPAWDVVI